MVRLDGPVLADQAGKVLRIRRDSGPTCGPWTHKEIAYGITSLPQDLAGPRHLAIYARNHWGIENREHYVRSPGTGLAVASCGTDATRVSFSC